MKQEVISERGTLVLEGEFWHFRLRGDAEESASPENIDRSMHRLNRTPTWVGVATGPKGLTKNEAQEIVNAVLLSQLRRQTISQRSSITVAEFVEHKFIPEFVESKTFAGRIHYHSMLKYVVNPEEVDRIFQDHIVRLRTRLRFIVDWPYLGNLRLSEVRPDSVQELTSFAMKQGYSTQTAAHIRKVVSTIFDFARKESYFSGENPAQFVQLPKVTRTESPHLKQSEIVRLISHMDYPVREMTLLAIILGMNAGEICGLQWKRVNLAEKEIVRSDGEVIPAGSIIVRDEWVRSQLIAVPQERKLNRTIPSSLLPILRELRRREEFTGLDDFLLVSKRGKPINPSNVLTERLKSIGREMNIPSLSWRHLRGIRKTLQAEFGSRFQYQMGRLVHAVSSHDLECPVGWRELVETELPQ
jgi:integrase